MKEMKVRLTFTEEILGTAAADKEIHKTYIASMAPNAPSKKEEVEALGVEAAIEKGMTIFPRNKEGADLLGLPDQGILQGCGWNAEKGTRNKKF